MKERMKQDATKEKVMVEEEEEDEEGQVAAAPDDDDGQGQTKKRKTPSSKQLLAEQQYKSQKASTAVIAPSKQITLGTETELLTNWERRRKEYKEKRRAGGDREKQTLDKLAKFQATLKHRHHQQQQPAAAHDRTTTSNNNTEPYVPAAWRIGGFIEEHDADDDQLNLQSLRQHTLQFSKDHLVGGDKHDDYTVVDPLAGREHHHHHRNGGGDRGKKREERDWNGHSR